MTIVYEFQNILLKYKYMVIKLFVLFFETIFLVNPLSANEQSVSSSGLIDKALINEHAEKLLNEYGNSILRLAYSYLHNMSDAEDILQDTLIQFIRKAPVFKNKQHEKAWLLRVAINISKNKIIHNKTRETDELNENLLAEEKEDLAFVWDAVKNLPSKYSEVIHLFYQENYTTAEIANILCKNEATVRSLLHRARAKLKETLKEGYDFE